MRKRRIGILSALVIVTIIGSIFAVHRITANQTTPDGGSAKLDICTGVSAIQDNNEQEKDQPCTVGSAGDEQAYGFGIDCTPTSTANPATCNGQFGPGTGRTATTLTITIVFSNPDLTQGDLVLAVRLETSFGSQYVADGNANCWGAADFATGLNTGQVGTIGGFTHDTGGCNDSSTTGGANAFPIHPGHCNIPAPTPDPTTCKAPSSGALTIRTTSGFTTIGGLSNGGPNVLVLDFYSGQDIAIQNIQAVIAYS